MTYLLFFFLSYNDALKNYYAVGYHVDHDEKGEKGSSPF